MFNVLDPACVSANPILAKAFIKLVPAHELAKHAVESLSRDFNQTIVLDQEPITTSILESNDTDLTLVLATYGKLDSFFGGRGYIDKLCAMGEAHKAAVFSNSRVDWYGFDLFQRESARKLLIEEMLKREPLAELIFKNPRMDRGMIADYIRGNSPFETATLLDRLVAAYLSIDAVEIPSLDYPGKDIPDSNELEFSKPIKAFLPLLRRAFLELPRDQFDAHLSHFLWKLPKVAMQIDSADWVLDQVAVEAGDSIEALGDKYEANSVAAFRGVVDFFASLTDRESQGYPENEATIVAATATGTVISKLLKQYGMSSNAPLLIEQLIHHPAWSIRASAYHVVFSDLLVSENGNELDWFLSRFPEDSFEKWVGISTTEVFQLLRRQWSTAEKLKTKLSTSQFRDAIEKWDDKLLQYLYLSDTDIGTRIQGHNRAFRPNDVEKLASRIISPVKALRSGPVEIDSLEEKLRSVTTGRPASTGFFARLFGR